MKWLLLLPMFLVQPGLLQVKKKKVIFFGDSITQMGVNSGGYIDLVRSGLTKKNRDKDFELIGAGIGGNKVYDLYLRLEDDVLNHNPDVVFIYIGINDVWHKTSGTGTDLDKYEKFYQAIINKLRKRNIRVILCTPTVIGEKKNNENPQDGDLDKYSAVVRKLAKANELTLVDLRGVFMDYEEKHNTENAESGILTTDRVHLNAKGNQLVADEVLKALL